MKKLNFALTAIASALVAVSLTGLVACSKDGGNGDPVPGEYTITLEVNGGTLTGAATVTTGEDGTLGVNYPGDPSKTDKKFEGWYPNEDLSGTKVTSTTVFYEDSTIYAKWGEKEQEEPVVTTYSVIYVIGEGATGTVPTENKHAEGEKFTVAAGTGLTKEGYVFVCWNDGKADVAAGSQYTMGKGKVTLTAVWKEADPEPEANQVLVKFACGARVLFQITLPNWNPACDSPEIHLIGTGIDETIAVAGTVAEVDFDLAAVEKYQAKWKQGTGENSQKWGVDKVSDLEDGYLFAITYAEGDWVNNNFNWDVEKTEF